MIYAIIGIIFIIASIAFGVWLGKKLAPIPEDANTKPADDEPSLPFTVDEAVSVAEEYLEQPPAVNVYPPVGPHIGYSVSTTISDVTLCKAIQIESAGRPDAGASTSSAKGLGQFISTTWLAMIGRYRKDLLKGASTASILSMRYGGKTTRLQIDMMARFWEENYAYLVKYGIAPTDGNLYLAHFLGPYGARMVAGYPLELVSKHLDAAAIRANKSILSGKVGGQVSEWAQKAMSTRWVKAGMPDWIKTWYK